MRQQISGKLLARIGTTVQQKYRIQRLIGVGGMAAVYAAAHRNGHRVAIKFLLEHASNSPDIRHLFSREAYVANQVGHPGVVSVLDDDVDDEGCPFLIMPLLEGETLRARWERSHKRLPLAEVSVIMLDVLDVLASAHAKGIVHRDIKPENLFVTMRGEIRVLDFGIARRTQEDGNATITGRMFGTPAFMPPEQAIGNRDAIGPHSDCWSVGATIFSLLSGEYVHQGDSAGSLLVAAATKPARSLNQLVPTLPISIVHFVDKALTLEPSSRWQSATEMREALITIFEDVVGKPIAIAATQIREEIVRELSLEMKDAPGEETQDPLDVRGDSIGVDPGAPSTSGRDMRTPRRRLPRFTGSDGATILEANLQPVSSWKHRRPWLVILAIMGALVIGSAIIASPTRTPSATPAEKAPDSNLTDTVSQAASGNADALIQLAAGIQSWRDASDEAAGNSFTRAIQLDPGLAAAHLYLSMVPTWPDSTAREHHHSASIYRWQLNARDQLLLDAYAPAMAMPSDIEASEQRLVAARKELPSDALILRSLAEVYIKRGKLREAIDVADELLQRAPSFAAMAWSEKSLAYGLLDDVKSARDAVDACLRLSPYARSCLELIVRLESNEGQCASSERRSRALMALPAPSDWSALQLAGAILGRGGAMATVQDVLEQMSRLSPESDREIVRFRGHTQFAILGGDFQTAQRALRAWSASLAAEKYERLHAELAKFQMYTALELGDRRIAAQVAADYQARRDAWFPALYGESDMLPLRVKYLAGRTPIDAFKKQRDQWLKRRSGDEPLIDMRNYHWIYAYALAAATPDDARDALVVLPQHLPIVDALTRDVEMDSAIGNVYLLAGDLDNAILYLRRGANSCKAVQFPFEHTWANLRLGLALERSGDVAGACIAYNVVTARWGGDRRSVSAATARSRLMSLKCN